MSDPKPSQKPLANGHRDQLRLGKAKRNLKGLKGHLNRHIEEAYAAAESGVSAGDLHNRYDDITKVWNKIKKFQPAMRRGPEVQHSQVSKMLSMSCLCEVLMTCMPKLKISERKVY